MSHFPVRIFRLAKRGAGSRGLCCDSEGASLGPVPLIFRARDVIGRPCFRAVAPEALADILALAYGPEFEPEIASRLQGLNVIARALTSGELTVAIIAASHLLLPEFSDEAARDLDRLAKYSPDQPRVPAGQPGGGQWTNEEDAAAPSPNGNDTGDSLADHNPRRVSQNGPRLIPVNDITFGHGARHVLDAAAVENAIIHDVTGRSLSPGLNIGTVIVGGVAYGYRAYLLPSGRVHVGTYFPQW